jgi:ABC-type dipeptide/oligopeptide/nickel transport system ATPase component
MTDLQNKIVGIVGRKGTGKSTHLGKLLRYCPRFVAFDVMGEHSTTQNRLERPAQLAHFLKWSRGQSRFACAYVPAADPEEEIEEVARLVYARGDLCFLCEEVPLYTQAGYMPPLFGKLARTGRHKQIDLCWTAQRAAEVPKVLTSQTDVWLLFSQTEPRDLSALADRGGREMADRVAKLGLHDHFVWDAVSHEEIEDSLRLLKR